MPIGRKHQIQLRTFTDLNVQIMKDMRFILKDCPAEYVDKACIVVSARLRSFQRDLLFKVEEARSLPNHILKLED